MSLDVVAQPNASIEATGHNVCEGIVEAYFQPDTWMLRSKPFESRQYDRQTRVSNGRYTDGSGEAVTQGLERLQLGVDRFEGGLK
jgi:hypothetical protein